MTARELALAHARATELLRADEHFALPVPSSIEVLTQLRRSGVDTNQRKVLRACARNGMRLADARTEGRRPRRVLW